MELDLVASLPVCKCSGGLGKGGAAGVSWRFTGLISCRCAAKLPLLTAGNSHSPGICMPCARTALPFVSLPFLLISTLNISLSDFLPLLTQFLCFLASLWSDFTVSERGHLVRQGFVSRYLKCFVALQDRPP